MDKNAWKTYYDVVSEDTRVEDGDLGSHWNTEYYIIDQATKEKVHGPYRDFSYALKQARRRYKKIIRNMEKALMS